MIRSFFILLAFIAFSVSAQPLANRVAHNDLSKLRQLSAVHDGAGKMAFNQMVGSNDLTTNFLYLHAGVVYPKGGIGHHFHHGIEEMYVLLSGEAEFTVNGRTSVLKAPVVVPCKMGDAHALYNPSGDTVRWLNFGVSTIKGRGDAFNTGDDRVGAAIDPIPVFVSSQLDQKALRANNNYNGALYKRIYGPEIFSTNWDHVDQIVIKAGKSTGPRQLLGVEEVYYVMSGSGTFTIGKETANVKANDAFTGKLGETITISGGASSDLELLVVGVAVSKNRNPVAVVAPGQPKAMVLQMDFIVTKENQEAFEKMYSSTYVPAMKVQQGYISSKLLHLFPEGLEKEIEGEPTTYNYQIQISFATEADRRKWVASPQHKLLAWPSATALAKEFKWRGYDVMGDDMQ